MSPKGRPLSSKGGGNRGIVDGSFNGGTSHIDTDSVDNIAHSQKEGKEFRSRIRHGPATVRPNKDGSPERKQRRSLLRQLSSDRRSQVVRAAMLVATVMATFTASLTAVTSSTEPRLGRLSPLPGTTAWRLAWGFHVIWSELFDTSTAAVNHVYPAFIFTVCQM